MHFHHFSMQELCHGSADAPLLSSVHNHITREWQKWIVKYACTSHRCTHTTHGSRLLPFMKSLKFCSDKKCPAIRKEAGRSVSVLLSLFSPVRNVSLQTSDRNCVRKDVKCVRPLLKRPFSCMCNRLRPYHSEHARSRLISEAKQGRAWLVLGWETAWEYQVL